MRKFFTVLLNASIAPCDWGCRGVPFTKLIPLPSHYDLISLFLNSAPLSVCRILGGINWANACLILRKTVSILLSRMQYIHPYLLKWSIIVNNIGLLISFFSCFILYFFLFFLSLNIDSISSSLISLSAFSTFNSSSRSSFFSESYR